MHSAPEGLLSAQTPLGPLTIHGLAYGGEGVGRTAEGLTVFVPGTAPGDEVEITVSEQRARYARGRPVRWLARSPDRVEPHCPHFGHCGGCHLQHLPPEAQRQWKRQFVCDALERVGRIESPPVATVPEPVATVAYRHHAELAVTADGRRLGFRTAGGAEVVAIDSCPLLAEPLNLLVGACSNWLSTDPSPDNDRWLRWVDLRVSSTTGKCTVLLWCRVAAPGPALELATHLVGVEPRVCAVYALTAGSRRRRQSPRQAVTILGEEPLTEVVANNTLRLSPQSFFQANPPEALRLLEAAAPAVAQVRRGILELYAGVGFFSFPLAAGGRRVTAVERSPSASRDFAWALKRNHVTGLKLRRGAAAAQLAKLAPQPGFRPDLVWLDPSRGGAGAEVVHGVGGLRPAQVVYVSCDPTTMSRDVADFLRQGYELTEAQPFDLFPQTYHVETVALLRRKTRN